jgi:hypothetical protein
MYGDNMAVVLNTTVPSSQLKKKHNAIAYHRVREAVAGSIIFLQHISTKVNFADCLTKPLPAFEFQRAVHPVLFRHKISMYSKTLDTDGQPGRTALGGGNSNKNLAVSDENVRNLTDEGTHQPTDRNDDRDLRNIMDDTRDLRNIMDGDENARNLTDEGTRKTTEGNLENTERSL